MKKLTNRIKLMWRIARAMSAPSVHRAVGEDEVDNRDVEKHFFKVVNLSYEDGAQSLVRVDGRKHIFGANPRPGERFHRDQLVLIENLTNGKTITRFIKGASAPRKVDPKSAKTPVYSEEVVGLDYDSRRALKVDANEEVELIIRPATPMEQRLFFLTEHHSFESRISSRQDLNRTVLNYFLAIAGLCFAIYPFI